MLLDSRLRRIVSESDVCQSVMTRFFVELWAGKYDFADPSHLVALLKKMVRTRIIDLTRHWTAQRRDIRRNVLIGGSGDGQPASTAGNPSRLLADAELLAEVQRRFTTEEREILDCRQHGLAWADVAARLNGRASPEALRKQYERAIARVSQDLGLGDDSP